MRRRIGRPTLAMFSGAWLLALAGSGDGAGPAPALEDLAYGKTAEASSFQGDDKWAGAAVDGNPESRWCAADGSAPQWLRVDLGRPEALTGSRIVWEHDGPYSYKVEGSADGKSWSTLTDQTKSRARAADRTHPFAARAIRHVRITVPEVADGRWASLFSFEVFGTKPAVARAAPKKDDDASILKGIKAPAGFELSVFAAPPDVRYPTCLSAAPTGEVYVGLDENGSLDAKANRGRVVRCVDTDGDGKADKFNVFATMDSPRGLIWDAGTLYVLHPPLLTAYHDDDNDGTADRSEDLVKGIGFDLKFRGADHTTNGIRLGIDGYIYVAVGDYGFIKAEGKDGASHQLLGGGVARVRVDGSGLEIVSRGQRNIYDVAIDPYLNLFTRDNTNDGDGWDVRLSHVVPTGHYGYPSLFKRFGGEHIQPLADYGGGSPCGSLFLQEPGLPAPYGDMLYTCEWGRGAVFMHPLEPAGAGFKARQETFLDIPRPTDMDVDGRGRIYVASWRDGGFTYSKPEIGYVIRVVAQGAAALPPFPDLKAATDAQLVGFVSAPGAVLRLAAQRELLRRGIKPAAAKALEAVAGSKDRPRAGRVAAIFALEQGLGAKSHDALLALARSSPEVREFAIKALADHRGDATKADEKAVASYRDDADPRVRLQAVIALGRIGQVAQAPALLPLTADVDPLVAHAAVKALVALKAVDAGLAALADPKLAPGASKALGEMHEPKVVVGLIGVADGSRDDTTRRAALKALCRLYFREAPYEGKWWGTRPDTSGPYYNAVTWDRSEAVGQALRSALKKSDEATGRWLLAEMLRNKVDFEETTALAFKLAGQDPALRSAVADLLISRPKLTLDSIKFLENIAVADADPAARAKAVRGLLRHPGQPEARESALRGLAAVADRDDPGADAAGAWVAFTKDNRLARDATTYVKLAEGADVGKAVLGFGVLVQVEANNRAPEGSRAEARKAIERAWTRPEAAARLLRAVGLARSDAYASQVRDRLADADPGVRRAAESAARRLDIATQAAPAAKPSTARPIAALPYEQVLAVAMKDKGDAALGGRLFEKQGCINCHSVAKGEAIKGPYLGDITARYSRAELTESILKPSAKISQGFETQKIALNSGQTYEGFVVREAGDEVEMRNSAGAVTVLSKKDIDERGKSELSVMPVGLLDPLTPHDLASVLAYLESLKGK